MLCSDRWHLGRHAEPREGGRACRCPRGAPRGLFRASCVSSAPRRSTHRKIFSKIVLASAGEFPYSTSSHGGVAQLGERLTGSQEVRGSIPLVSTIVNAKAFGIPKAFFHTKTSCATNPIHANKKLLNLFPMSVHSLLVKGNYQCSSLLHSGFRNVSNHCLHPNNLHQREQHPKTTPLSTPNERYVVQRSPNQFR